MTTQDGSRLVQLRGRLQPEEIGARGIVKAARNLDCQRLQALTLLGITPVTAATVYGEAIDEGPSPFALAAGNKFETSLLADNADRLFNLYREQGRLAANENRLVNAPALLPGVSADDLNQRLELSMQMIRLKLNRDPGAPNIIVKPRLVIRILGREYSIEPDALVADDTDSCYRVVEIKAYPDRAGKTSPADLRSARWQAAVGVTALRQALASIDAAITEEIARPIVDLILRKPGSNYPTLSVERIPGEVVAITRIIDRAAANLEDMEQLLAGMDAAAIDTPEALTAIPNNYGPGCREYCGLTPVCKQQAIALLLSLERPWLPSLVDLERREADAFASFMLGRDQGYFVPLRDNPRRAAFGFAAREEAAENFDASLLLEDRVARAQGKMDGQVLVGLVENPQIERTGPRNFIYRFQVRSRQKMLRVRRRDELFWADDTRLRLVVEDVRRESGTTLVSLKIQKGQRAVGQPRAGTTVELVPRIPDWSWLYRVRGHLKKRLAQTPWTHRNDPIPGSTVQPVPADPLAIVEALR